MKSQQYMAVTTMLIDYLDSKEQSYKYFWLSEWVVSELLSIADNCSGNETITDISDILQSDIESLIVSNSNDPRNSWLKKTLCELNSIKLYSQSKE